MRKFVGLDDVLAGEGADVRDAITVRGALLLEEIGLRKLRQSFGISQTRLAEKTGMTQNQISKLEAGLDPRISTLRRLPSAESGLRNFAAVTHGI